MNTTKETKNYEGSYSSISDFVERNSLQIQAEELFGEGWEPENDVENIQLLAGESYDVYELEVRTKRGERLDDYIKVKKS